MRIWMLFSLVLAVHAPGTALAGVANYTVVSGSSPSDSSSKSVMVECPVGTQLLGGGARIAGSITTQALLASGPEGPLDAPTKWFAFGDEVSDTPGNWTLIVDAFCGNVSGYEVISQSGSSDSTGFKTGQVSCPAGKQLLGGGSRIFGTSAGQGLTASGPDGPIDAPTGWFAAATEAVATSANWGLRVDAICGVVSGYEVVSNATTSNSNTSRSVVAGSPMGKLLIGGGSRIFGSITTQVLSTSGPFSTNPASGWFSVAAEASATGNNWGIRADAIHVPEPASALSGVAASAALAGLARRRRTGRCRFAAPDRTRAHRV